MKTAEGINLIEEASLYIGDDIDISKQVNSNKDARMLMATFASYILNKYASEYASQQKPTDEEIIQHIVKHCRNSHDQKTMDEQAYYEGAKDMRDNNIKTK